MGYELEMNVKLGGLAGGDYEGAEALIKIIELCDDLSEPQINISVPTKKDKQQGTKLKQAIAEDDVVQELVEKSRQVLNTIRDQP